MDTTYEYKFVRLGEYKGSAWFGVSAKARQAVHPTRATVLACAVGPMPMRDGPRQPTRDQ
jgi:hypothetical protein